MAQVFISYSRQDAAKARQVAKALEAEGYDIWWDEDLPAHRAYSKEIRDNLEAAKAVVVLWSNSAADSEWVIAEADLARNNKKIVQATLDDVIPPLPFNQIQFAELKGWRGNRKAAPWRKLDASVASLVGPKTDGHVAEPAPAASPRWRPSNWRAVAAIASIALLVGLFFMFGPGYREEKPPVVAVLPFESADPANAGLVAGIWEDTRQAIARNPQLLVLGPHTARELAKADSSTLRETADFLLEGSVRAAGQRLKISANLIRTKDGAQVWSKSFDEKSDDVFALQQRIAEEIEGHIRGRLAKSGGVRPENIATTGEVYSLYNDARDTLFRRDAKGFGKAHEQLEKAVKLDPNFAPAWATLAMLEWSYAGHLAGPNATFEQAAAHARRAIELAPNLAAGHAALAMVTPAGPAAELSLRRAQKLDPNDVQILSWLASVEGSAGRMDEALRLYDRAQKIEPLWWPAVEARMSLWFDTGNKAAIDRELVRVDKLGDPRMSTLAHMYASEERGDLSAAAKDGLKYVRNTDPSHWSGIDDMLASILLRLGYDDAAWQLSNAPPHAPAMWRGDPAAFEMFEARHIPPSVFWRIAPMSEVVIRSYVVGRRDEQAIALYRGAGGRPDILLATLGSKLRYLHNAPILAVALQRSGDAAGARALIAKADEILSVPQAERISARDREVHRARVLAIKGKGAEAVAHLRKGLALGWSPWAPLFRPDLEGDPAFALVKDQPGFQQLRKQVLAQLAKERAELGPVRLNSIAAATPS